MLNTFAPGQVRNPQPHQVSDNEALIESTFRRLLASIESEREKLRSTWNTIDTEEKESRVQLDQLRLDTEEWCQAERTKIESEWKRLDKLRERMSVLYPANRGEILEINCSGTVFLVKKAALCQVEGSLLNHMFSDAFIQSIPKDRMGRFFVDFNPFCFSIICQFLEDRMIRPDAPVPRIPPEQQLNMDLLAEALRLKPFLRTNSIASMHSTSLKVSGNSIQATYTGWQIISSQQPLPMANTSYFEMKVLANPDKKGGLAVGICGHIPEGTEVHSIRIPDAVWYNSNTGLIGSGIAVENVTKGIAFVEGSVLGIKHDVSTRTLHWYHNKAWLGACSLKPEILESMRVLYPVFALYTPGQKIEVDFSLMSPTAIRQEAQSAVLKAADMKAIQG